MARRGDGIYHRSALWIASLLSAIVLMAPAAASALAFSTFAAAEADIRENFNIVDSLRVQAPLDQALIDISAPISMSTGGATVSALATLKSVVTTTSSGGIISFGTAEATGVIDPLLVTPVVFPSGVAQFQLLFESGNAPMAVAFSGTIHMSGAELNSDSFGSGIVQFVPVEGLEIELFQLVFFLPTPADVPFAFSTVVKPNRALSFTVAAEVFFEDPVNFSTNFRDSRLDFTFTATPVPGPSPLLLLVGGLAAIVLIYGRTAIAKRRS